MKPEPICSGRMVRPLTAGNGRPHNPGPSRRPAMSVTYYVALQFVGSETNESTV